jgi:hypothetical protein
MLKGFSLVIICYKLKKRVFQKKTQKKYCFQKKLLYLHNKSIKGVLPESVEFFFVLKT